MAIKALRAENWIAALVVALLILLGAVTVVRPNEVALQPGQTFRDCTDCPEMVVIPAGSFLMGSSDEETARDVGDVSPTEERSYAQRAMSRERPQHPVKIDQPFALGRYGVTQGEFAAFVRETGYSTEGGCYIYTDHRYPLVPEDGWQNPGFAQTERDPVVCVSWQDAKAYVAWLNGRLHSRASLDGGGPYRLPSEAEWEYAARAGTRTARWWGDPIGSGNADCDGCGSRSDSQQPAPTASFQANAFGLSDVLGGAWEWTEDCWNETYVGAPQDGGAWGRGRCELRVMKGGDWSNRPWVLRSAHRSREKFRDRTNYIGFRIARTLP
jgi:formylglycine-generating enzyme required for sulfatase activity